MPSRWLKEREAANAEWPWPKWGDQWRRFHYENGWEDYGDDD